MPNIVHFGPSRPVWCKKLGFTAKNTEQRLIFCRGDVIQYHNSELGRLDQVFVHQLMHVRQIFCLVTKVLLSQDQRDNILDVPLLQPSKNQLIIGLPAVSGQKLYMLPVSRDSENDLIQGDDMLLWVDWQIQFL